MSYNNIRNKNEEEDDDVIPILKDGKCTNAEKDTLETLTELLKCPLCEKIFDEPTTLLACAHTFCFTCIDQYSRNETQCPECGMLMGVTGGRGGSFMQNNREITQTVESVKLICQALNRSPDNWWKSNLPPPPSSAATVESSSQNQIMDAIHEKEEEDFDDDYDDDETLSKPEDEERSVAEEDMVDLQALNKPPPADDDDEDMSDKGGEDDNNE